MKAKKEALEAEEAKTAASAALTKSQVLDTTAAQDSDESTIGPVNNSSRLIIAVSAITALAGIGYFIMRKKAGSNN